MPTIPETLAEIRSRARITDVWSALGGGKLRGNRGQGFWRGGTGLNVSLDLQKGLWHDFRDNVGGDVITLVMQVQGCDFRAAVQWLADFTGVALSNGPGGWKPAADPDWPGDLERAIYWALAVEHMIEMALEELEPWSLKRRGLTRLLHDIGLGDATLVAVFRAMRQRDPLMADGLVRAGQLHDARLQRRLTQWLRRYLNGA